MKIKHFILLFKLNEVFFCSWPKYVVINVWSSIQILEHHGSNASNNPKLQCFILNPISYVLLWIEFLQPHFLIKFLLELSSICFELDDKIVGIAHYRTMPRPIKGQYIGFLDDLFVEPEFRGQKIAQKLISHLKSLSKANNWDGIRWITHSSNENAKKLYDKIANNTGFELYELKGN